MIPRNALSAVGAPGQPFHDPAADQALFQSISAHSNVPIDELDEEINSRAFARACAEKLLHLMTAARPATHHPGT